MFSGLPIELRLAIYSYLMPDLLIKKRLRVSDDFTANGLRLKVYKPVSGVQYTRMSGLDDTASTYAWRTFLGPSNTKYQDACAASLLEVTCYANLWAVCRASQRDLLYMASKFTLAFDCPWQQKRLSPGYADRQYYDTSVLAAIAKSGILQRTALPWSHCMSICVIMTGKERVEDTMDIFRTFVESVTALKSCVPPRLLPSLWLETKFITPYPRAENKFHRWPKYMRPTTDAVGLQATEVEWEEVSRDTVASLCSKDCVCALDVLDNDHAKFWYIGPFWSFIPGEYDDSYTNLPWHESGDD